MVDGKWNKFRDDVTHDGHKVDWGKWAITGNDPVFGGTGNPDTGARSQQPAAPMLMVQLLQAWGSVGWLAGSDASCSEGASGQLMLL